MASLRHCHHTLHTYIHSYIHTGTQKDILPCMQAMPTYVLICSHVCVLYDGELSNAPCCQLPAQAPAVAFVSPLAMRRRRLVAARTFTRLMSRVPGKVYVYMYICICTHRYMCIDLCKHTYIHAQHMHVYVYRHNANTNIYIYMYMRIATVPDTYIYMYIIQEFPKTFRMGYRSATE